MHFYIPDLKANKLTQDESSHLFVMRVQEDKTYTASDLEGRTCKILIRKVDKKSKTIEFEQAEIPKTAEFKFKIMFQAIPDKLYLDKLCEVLPLSGVTDLFLFYSDNSVQYPVNQERITKILIRSCEQAKVAYLPKIIVLNKKDLDLELKKHLPTVLDCNVALTQSLSHENSFSTLTYIAGNTMSFAEEGIIPPVKGARGLPQNSHSKQEQSHKPALIGPEGGWSESEIKYFQSLNLSFESLGSIIYPAWIAGLVWESNT
jgi:RsmE family RNA methyltransferase